MTVCINIYGRMDKIRVGQKNHRQRCAIGLSGSRVETCFTSELFYGPKGSDKLWEDLKGWRLRFLSFAWNVNLCARTVCSSFNMADFYKAPKGSIVVKNFLSELVYIKCNRHLEYHFAGRTFVSANSEFCAVGLCIYKSHVFTKLAVYPT